jgi:hypothetical protein
MVDIIFNESILEVSNASTGNRVSYSRRSTDVKYTANLEKVTVTTYGDTENLVLTADDINTFSAVINGTLVPLTPPATGLELYAFLTILMGGESSVVQAASGLPPTLPAVVAAVDGVDGGKAALKIPRFIGRGLEELGNPGNFDITTANGSPGSPVIFEYTADVPSNIQQINLYLEDNAAFKDSEFGGIGPGLTNGCILLIDGTPVGLWRTNRDIVLQARSVEEHPFLANQSRHILAKTILDPELYLPEGSKVQLIVQDDLTPLVEFQIYVRGYRLQDPAP